MQPWGINVYRLIIAIGLYAHNAVASGLWFTRSNRDFLP
ncbi:Uncharacterised protein [Vibrio cholerae]|nr:Uncharacterised protein [Vibrio cholerae]